MSNDAKNDKALDALLSGLQVALFRSFLIGLIIFRVVCFFFVVAADGQ